MLFRSVQVVNALPTASATTNLPTPQNIPKSLAILAGAVFALASAATNLSYAVTKADTLAGQITWGAVAVAASIALALAPSALVQCLSQRRFGAATVALGAILIFGGYSVTAALGSATGGRLVNELEASDVATKRRDATATIAKAELELSGIGAVRSVTQIEAAISATYTNTPGLTECRQHDPNWRP